MKRKMRRVVTFVFSTLMIVASSVSVVVGVDTVSNAITQPPQALQLFLNDLLVQIGKAENEFVSVDISSYFENPLVNESYLFAKDRIDYYQSFRTKMFDPVENLEQQIHIVDYQTNLQGEISVTVEHSVMFSYAHAYTNSSKTLTYDMCIIQDGTTYRVRSMSSDDIADTYYQDNQTAMQAQTMEYHAMPEQKNLPVDTSLLDVQTIQDEQDNISSISTSSADYITINRNNVVNYSYTYTKNDDSAHAVYNKLFFYLSADCMNFASQCIWAGLGGSDSVSAVTNGDRPMDREGSYQWYRLRSGTNSGSWQGTLSFNSYIENMKNASDTESGLVATIFDLAEGENFANVPASVRLGSIVLGPMPSPAHAAVIVKVDGTGRNNVYVNAHNPSRVDWQVGYEWGTSPLRVVSVGSYRSGTTCTHSYSSVASGNGTDATCNLCGHNRVTIMPTLLQPQSVNSTVSLSATTGYTVYSLTYKIYAVNSDGTRGTTAIATGSTVRNTNTMTGTYCFTQTGLYEIEFTAVDCNTESNTITSSMRIRIQ